MTMLIEDKYVSQQVIAQRRAQGLDRWDEVWDGVYRVMTQPSDEHQNIVAGLTAALYEVIQRTRRGKVRPGVNISDRLHDWKSNYRCPDVVVYLATNLAENHGSFWYGGPDLAIEIVSPGDDCHAKLDFYAAVNTHEVLFIDRSPWTLELFRLNAGALQLVGESTAGSPALLACHSVPLTFQLLTDGDEAHLRVTHTQTAEEWLI